MAILEIGLERVLCSVYIDVVKSGVKQRKKNDMFVAGVLSLPNIYHKSWAVD
jgi:hypothetical protein